MSSECLLSVFPLCTLEVISLVLGCLLPEIAVIFWGDGRGEGLGTGGEGNQELDGR